MDLSVLLQLVPMVQSHAYIPLLIVVLGLVSKWLSSDTPGIAIPPRARVGVVIGLSGASSVLEALASHRALADATISGVVVVLGALAAHDGEALRALFGIPPSDGSGSGDGKDPKPEPKAAPPGTFRSSLDSAALASGLAFLGFATIASLTTLVFLFSGCAALKPAVKTALDVTQIACVLEHATLEADAPTVAKLCDLEADLAPIVQTILSEHHRAAAREIGAAKPCAEQ